MTHEELRDYYELYAIGLADEPERNEIREHLDRGCEVCMTAMKRAREMAAVLGGTVAVAQPSPKLRRRILASVGVEQHGFSWALVWAPALALALVAAVYFSGREKQVADEAQSLRELNRQQSMALTHLNEAFQILNAPDTKTVSFGLGQPQPPKGRVFLNPKQGVVMFASNLPQAPKGKAYEMWTIPKATGKPIPAGMFQPGNDGTALHIFPGPVDPNTTIAVTVEDQAGASSPTTQPVIAAPMGPQ
jgi:hypothetical protein